MDLYSFRLDLPSSCKMAGAFFADSQMNPASFIETLSRYRPDPHPALEEIDSHLADYVKRHAPQSIPAIGITLHIPDVPGPTGGIIGNPHRRMSSADGRGEVTGKGLSCAAHAGGPGLVIAGEPETAEAIIQCASPGSGGPDILKHLLEKARDREISQAFALTDGCGWHQQGGVALL
ncbi:MAG: hypothetical protein ACLFQ6_04420, partial [Candidatus Sumerlaeia bacterium]